MILKGNQRGGGQQLAAHLLNSFDNERVEIADLRGSVAQDLSGAFSEWFAHSRATRCRKYLYSLSLNPDNTQGGISREQYLDLIGRTERSLKLIDQPRAVVFHVKEGREHCHVVWSRIDTSGERIRSVQIAHDRLKLRAVVLAFAREHNLKLPPGMRQGKSEDRQAFNHAARPEDLGEKQQQERTGISKAARMEEIAACWNATTDSRSFVKALEERNYHLARGDQRDYVVVDLFGEVHSLSRQLAGTARSKNLRERLVDVSADSLRDVVTTQAYVKTLREQRAKKLQQPREMEQRTSALQARQENRRNVLARMRVDLFARHISERAELRNLQKAENETVKSGRRPGRFTSFLSRITGVGRVVAWAQGQGDKKREVRHRDQAERLMRRHAHELKAVERHERALDRLDTRENRAVATALKRESCRRLCAFPLKPEFNRGVTGDASSTVGDARRLAEQFRQRAREADFRKGDLQSAFERAKSSSSGSTTAGGNVRKKSPTRKPGHDHERDEF
jgi:hypothetical protein